MRLLQHSREEQMSLMESWREIKLIIICKVNHRLQPMQAKTLKMFLRSAMAASVLKPQAAFLMNLTIQVHWREETRWIGSNS